jgi:hypothetical protein
MTSAYSFVSLIVEPFPLADNPRSWPSALAKSRDPILPLKGEKKLFLAFGKVYMLPTEEPGVD